MENQHLSQPCGPEGSEVHRGQGIDEVIRPRDADLDEAELLKVAMQGIRFRIDGDAFVGREQREDRCETFGCARQRYHDESGDAAFSAAMVWVWIARIKMIASNRADRP